MPSYRTQNTYYHKLKFSRSKKRKANKEQAKIQQQFEFISQIAHSHTQLSRAPKNALEYVILMALAMLAIGSLPVVSAKRQTKFEDYKRLKPGSHSQYTTALTLLTDNSSGLTVDQYYHTCASTLMGYEISNYPWHPLMSSCIFDLQQLTENVLLLGNHVGLGRYISDRITHFTSAAHEPPKNPSVDSILKNIEMASALLKAEIGLRAPTFTNLKPLLYIKDAITSIKNQADDSGTPGKEHTNDNEDPQAAQFFQPYFTALYDKHKAYAIPRSLKAFSKAPWGSTEHYRDALSLSSLLVATPNLSFELQKDICSVATFGQPNYRQVNSLPIPTSDNDLIPVNRFPMLSAPESLAKCLGVFQRLYKTLRDEQAPLEQSYVYFGLFSYLYETATDMPGTSIAVNKGILHKQQFIDASLLIFNKWMDRELANQQKNFVKDHPLLYVQDYLSLNQQYFTEKNIDQKELLRRFNRIKVKYLIDNSNLLATPLMGIMAIYLTVILCLLRSKKPLPEEKEQAVVALGRRKKLFSPVLPKPIETGVPMVPNPIRTPENELTKLLATMDHNLLQIKYYLTYDSYNDAKLENKKRFLDERQRALIALKEHIMQAPKDILTTDTIDAFIASFEATQIDDGYFMEFKRVQEKLARHHSNTKANQTKLEATRAEPAPIIRRPAAKVNPLPAQTSPSTEPTQIIETPPAQLTSLTTATSILNAQPLLPASERRIGAPAKLMPSAAITTPSPLTFIATSSAAEAYPSASSGSYRPMNHHPSFFRPQEPTFCLADALPKRLTTVKPDEIYLGAARDALEAMRALCNEAQQQLSEKTRWGLMYHLMRFHHVLCAMQRNDQTLHLPVEKEEARTIRNMLRHAYFLHDYDLELVPYATALCGAFYKRLIATIDQDKPLEVTRLDYPEEKPFAEHREQAIISYQADATRLEHDIKMSITTIALLFNTRDAEILFVNDVMMHGAMKMLINVLGENLKLLQRHPTAYRHLLNDWHELSKAQKQILLETMSYSNRIGHHFDDEGEAKKQTAMSSELMQDEPGGRSLYRYEEIPISILEAITEVACILAPYPSPEAVANSPSP